MTLSSKISKFLLAGLVAILLAAPADSLGAEEEEEASGKLGVLDYQEVARTSLMTKDIARQKDAKRRKFREEIRNEEQALRKANDELQKQRVILSQEAFAEEVRKFRLKSAALQKKVQQRNREFNRITAYTDKAFQAALQDALTQVTKKRNYILVLKRRPNVLVRAEFLDITGFVLKALNKNVPNFKIPDDIEKAIKAKEKKRAAAKKSTGTKPKSGK